MPMGNASRNIVKLANGRYRVRIWRGGRLYTGTFDSAAQARSFRDALDLDHQLRRRGLAGLIRERPTLIEVMDRYLDGLGARGVSAPTQDYYRYALAGPRKYLLEELRRPGMAVDELDDAQVGRYIAWRLGHRLTARSHRPPSEPQVVKDLAVLGFAIREARLPVPYRIPRKLKRRGQGKRIVSAEDRRRWLEAMPVGSVERAYAELLSATGMRPSDAAALRLDQVDFDGRVLRRFVTHKTRTAIEIPLSDGLLRHLRAWLASERVRPLSGILFHVDGRPIRATTLRSRFLHASKAAGISPPIAYPGLTRNAVIATLLAAGAPPYLVSKLVGHADLRTTLDYARRANPTDELRGIADQLDALRERS